MIRSAFGSRKGENSTLYDVLLGTVQGSVLGLVLFAIFISPIFDLDDVSAFADNNYVIKTNKDTGLLKISIETSFMNIL